MPPALAAFLTFLLFLASGCTDQEPQSRKAEPREASRSDLEKPFAMMTSVERDALREKLAKEGKYDCCTDPGCTECMLNPGECTCQANLRQKDPICGECLTGYKEGRGKLKLVSIVELEKIRREKLESEPD